MRLQIDRHCATPEESVCQWETLDEILAVLALCTPTQRERFLPYRQWQMPADETRPVLCRALGADEIEEHRLSALWRQTTRQSTLAEFAQ